ncbi:MAG: response regulator [Candidatus Loosdrechtia sp.]|uniref:response regulator n=1 Tax=Candidatus Loosdrechtia sp. TaxID=3101272 RepID=UPI003A6F2C87|nr:MAG: response regulator [Candidatus Jettenia sp. AMX2]
MKIRHKLVILSGALLVTLNGTIGYFIYKRTRQEYVTEYREKAKLLALELETVRNYLASALEKSGIEINEQTRYFIPAVSGHAIGEEFARRTGYIIKQTSLEFRREENKPDAFEEKILRKMEEDPELSEYWAADVINGKRVKRYLYALYITKDCLLCHGPKEKAPKYVQENYDIGYDYKIGELRGALSIVVPRELAEQRFIANVTFFMILGSISIVLIVAIIFITTAKFMRPIEKLTDTVTNIIKTGNFSEKVDISSRDEVGLLGKAFNKLADTCHVTYATLEQRIAEKTAHLQNANIELERANKMKSEFLANMSHELRTPLNAIIGFAEVLRDKISGDLNEEQIEFVKDIHSSGQHLLQMINDILDLSKIEAGRMTLQYEVFSVPEVIEDVYTILKGLVNKKALQVKMSIPPDVGMIEADRVKFKQILYNLISNAIKFTPQTGNISIEAMIRDNKLQVSVADTGIGMKPEDQEKVFREFWQADSSFARKYEGTGLGLTLSKKIVEMHRGEIWFESEYGKGSTFYFSLPLNPSYESPVSKEPETVPSSAEKGKRTILVVEDDRMAASLLTVYLKNAGYEVAVAADGEEAIRKAKELHPFLITLDIMLPKIDGWNVLSELKNSKDTEDIPVVIISIVDNKDLGYSLGAAEYLIKPVEREKLVNTVNSCLSSGQKKETPFRILVVDDDEKTVKYMSTVLEDAGFEVFKAYDGKVGINLAINSNPDLIILDLIMPEVNGFEVVEKLRVHPGTKGIPIIICSAKDITSEERDELNGNVLAIMQKKNYTQEDLLAAVKRVEKLRSKEKR